MLPLNWTPIAVYSIPVLALVGFVLGGLYNRACEEDAGKVWKCVTACIGAFIGSVLLAMVTDLLDNPSSMVLRPTEAQIAAEPSVYFSYCKSHVEMIPKRVLARAALQAYADAEAISIAENRGHILDIAHSLTDYAVPRPLDEKDQQAREMLKPVAGAPVPAEQTTVKPVVALTQMAQLRLVAEGN